IKNFIKCNTPTRPDLKSELISLQEKERQRLESLRKKQEAEEQRKKKVEEEKRRRQAEMKQKREERLRKALQARERVEQMEEEKKKRMEQKILQNDDKVRLSQGREEKVAEERSKKKLSKKHGEADTWKQKVLRVVRATLGPSCMVFFLLQEEDEVEQQEPLQKGREDEGKAKGKKVLELKNLVEQQQVEKVKERYWLDEENPKELHQLPGQEKSAKPPESIAGASNPWLKVVKVSMSPRDLVDLDLSKDRSCSVSESWVWGVFSAEDTEGLRTFLQGPQKIWLSSRGSLVVLLGSPKVNENDYGMDLNSDDSTDDENEPRKPVPAWADGSQLNQAISHQYYHSVNVDQIFGLIPRPKLEDIFGKSKPRYFKRTSSAVWHSAP
ncbi:INCE protein, partial [Ibidorhyncha struthersii]|nr:INCE protein [Ibidorhyncha struthersii]